MRRLINQLLYFIIPSAVCWAVYAVLCFWPEISGNIPAFMSQGYYLRLFVNDRFFALALINTFLIPFAAVILTSVILFVLKKLFFRSFRRFDIIAYPLLFIINTAYLYRRLVAVAGYPSYLYAAGALLKMDAAAYIKPFFLAAQAGIFACFIFWLCNIIAEKIREKRNLHDKKSGIYNKL